MTLGLCDDRHYEESRRVLEAAVEQLFEGKVDVLLGFSQGGQMIGQMMIRDMPMLGRWGVTGAIFLRAGHLQVSAMRTYPPPFGIGILGTVEREQKKWVERERPGGIGRDIRKLFLASRQDEMLKLGMCPAWLPELYAQAQMVWIDGAHMTGGLSGDGVQAVLQFLKGC